MRTCGKADGERRPQPWLLGEGCGRRKGVESVQMQKHQWVEGTLDGRLESRSTVAELVLSKVHPSPIKRYKF